MPLLNKNDIEKELKVVFDNSDKEMIKKLASSFHKIREREIKNNIKSKKKIDKMMTDGICVECRDYLIKQLQDSQGLFFWKNYLKNCQKLQKDLEELIKSKDNWGKFEMKIIKQ